MKIGILGAGRISSKMCNNLKLTGLNKDTYIASRDIEKAKQYQKEYDLAGACASYEELLNKDDIKLVYIGTVNSLHYQHAKMCLEHNKNVLIEKPIALRVEEAEELYEIARKKNLYLAEALWTAYMPSIKEMKTLLDKDFKTIESTKAVFRCKTIQKERVKDKSLGGGALYDLGIYPLALTFLARGFDHKEIKIKNIEYDANGIDLKEEVEIIYDNGSSICVIDATDENRESYLEIKTKDSKMILNPLECPKILTIYKANEEPKIKNVSPEYMGFEYEVAEAISSINEGKIESESWNREKSLKTLYAMNKIVKF